MKMTTAAASTSVKLVTLFWTVVILRAQQNTGCGSLKTQYAIQNLRNLSAGMSSDVLRKSALAPLLAQPRVSGTPGNENARRHIIQWMRTAGWTVEEDSFEDNTPYGRKHFSNIVATLNPNRARRVILACHYDSKLMLGSNQPFIGATDSAVPCALLMDSAHQLRDVFRNKTGSSSTSDLTVQFIFFDGEEAFLMWTYYDSLYGARHLAQKWANTLDPNSPGQSYLQTIEVLILLDLIGTKDTHFKNRFVQTAAEYAKLQNVELCLKEKGYLKATRSPQQLFTSQWDFAMVEDDHLPFLQRGVPVVHLITTPFPDVWHTLRDQENALDYDLIDNLARVLRTYLADLPL